MYKVDKSMQDHPAWGFALNTELCWILQLRNVNQHLSYLWWLINRKLNPVHDTEAFSYLSILGRFMKEKEKEEKKKREKKKKKRNLSKQNKELSRTFKAAAFYFTCQNKYCQISKAYWTNYKLNANLSTEIQW